MPRELSIERQIVKADPRPFEGSKQPARRTLGEACMTGKDYHKPLLPPKESG